MYEKQFYRELLIGLQKRVKISSFCYDVGVDPANLSRFLNKNDDSKMSVESLQQLYKAIHTFFKSYK